MSVRFFDGVDDKVTLALGSLGFAFGPGTIAAILKRGTDGSLDPIIHVGGISGSTRYALNVSATNALQARVGSTTTDAPTITVTVADGWVLIAFTKASGTVAPRFHKYNFGTATWTHENAGVTIANSGIPSGSAAIASVTSGSGFFHGDAGIAGVDNTALSDLEIEAVVASRAAWDAEFLVANWPLDQASTATAVQDIVGTADQTAITGTSVTADDIPWTAVSGVAGTAAQTLPAVTQAAVGTHTGPGVAGTAAQTLPALTQASSGTHTAPTFAGTATNALPALTQAAAGTVTAPSFAGTSAQTLPALSQAATGAVVAPSFAGTSAQTLPAVTQDATGAVVAPTFAATAAQTLPAIVQAAAGDVQPPGASTIEQTLPSLTQSATGTHVPPTFTGAAAQTLPAIGQATAGSTQPPTYTATSAQTLPTLAQSAVATTTIPSIGAVVAQELPALTQTATGAVGAISILPGLVTAYAASGPRVTAADEGTVHAAIGGHA